MDTHSPRTLFVIAALGLLITLSSRASAEPCRSGCANGQRVCSLQARMTLLGCLQGCARDDTQCGAACVGAYRSSRTACRAARSDCGTTCPQSQPAEVAPNSCAGACGTTARSCFSDALAAARACASSCVGTDGTMDENCLKQCAAGAGDQKAACLAAMQSCLADCVGTPSGTCFSTVDMQCTAEACGPGKPCTQPNQFCSERCAAPPPNGTCFDRATQKCTDQTCSSAQPCADGQTCLRVCPPPGAQQKCFDTSTKQCTDQTCDPAHPCSEATQICTLQCPPPPPKGTCFDTSAMQCLDQACSHEQPCEQPNQRCVPQCPPPTPVPPCANVPCGGPCPITANCAAGQECPENVQRGECASDDAGNCSCVPVSPPPTRTPKPTPVPPCDAAACGGPCTLSDHPCPPNGPCDGDAAKVGQCEVGADGSCACVVPTPTARPTRTPQCGGEVCGGACEIGPNCDAAGQPCPAFPTRRGQCTADDAGGCSCVPVSPPPTQTRKPTPVPPTPQCGGDVCGGSCELNVSACPGNMTCGDGHRVHGQCALDDAGNCRCVPVSPPPTQTPKPTPVPPTPQCGGDVCGGSCELNVSACPGNVPCGDGHRVHGQCALDDAGNCRCVPPSPPPTASPAPPPKPCDANACGGHCLVPFPCPNGANCPALVLDGECTKTAAGGCECVRVMHH